MKSRGVYETPAGAIIMEAHQKLEQLCLDRKTTSFKATVAQRFAELRITSYNVCYTKLLRDPSGRRVLLDPIRDSRAVVARDSLSTATIDDVGVWGYAEASGSPLGYVPDRDSPLRAPLAAWEASYNFV